jgi:hypothetical protein
VKIVAQLLPFLPPAEEYRLIFMHPRLEEVIPSQRAMLQRLGRRGARLADRGLNRAYVAELVRIRTRLIQVLSAGIRGSLIRSARHRGAARALSRRAV